MQYALGEIALVVIGILIALQLNNWNELNKDKLIEKNLLNELRIDLEQTILELQQNISNRNKLLVILDESFNYLYFSKADRVSIKFPMIGLFLRSTFTPKLSAYQSIQSKGITNIHNELLRKDITELFEMKYPSIKSYEETFVKVRDSDFIPLVYAFVETGTDCVSCNSLKELMESENSLESNWIHIKDPNEKLKLAFKALYESCLSQRNQYDILISDIRNVRNKIDMYDLMRD